MHRLFAAMTGLILGCAMLTGCAGTPLDGAWMLEHRELPDGTIVEPPEVMGYMTFRNGVRTTAVHWNEADGEHSHVGVAIYDMAKYEYAERNLYHARTAPGAGTEFDRNDYTASEEVVYTERGRRFRLPLHDEPLVEVGAGRLTATMPGEYIDHWVRVKVVEPAGADGAAPGTLQPADAAEEAAEEAEDDADEPATMEDDESTASAEPQK